MPRLELVHRGDSIVDSIADRLVFFDAEDQVPYGDAMAVLDAARGGGAANIAVATEAIQ